MKKNYISLVLFLFMLSSWSQEYRRMISTGTYTVQEIQEEAEAYFAIVGRERGKGYKPYKRWEYQALRNMDENGMLKSPEFYYNELQNYNNYLNRNNQLNRSTLQGNWQDLGPTYWNATSGWNPGVGRITSLAVDPVNTDHIIVGANTGGVWKTMDRGLTWTVLTDNLSNLYVYSLAMDPTNSSTYFWGTSSGTIFKSIDSGATWSFLADTGNGNVNKILIDPTNTNKMYCSVEGGGIYKSINGGVNWSIINASATNGYDVEFKPGNTNTIYASGNQFFKSTDGGTTFESSIILPQLWSQDYVSGSTDWTISSTNQNNSVTPKTGDSMAQFYIGDFSQPITRLVSPSLNLTGASLPELKFSYTQVQWSGDQDQLRVLYKTSAAGAWTELANYTTEVTSWLDITLSLPDPSSDYYIAFEGAANYGRGVTLDDVSINDVTLGVVFSDGFESASIPFSSGPKMIGVSANNPAVVYVLEAAAGIFGGFYKSTDSGNTFTKLNHGTDNYFGYSSAANDNLGQAPRDMDIAVNPNNVNEVHIAGINTWRSTDGGTVFNITSQWNPGTVAEGVSLGYCHADIDIMEFVGNELYVGSDGGIFVAENTATVNSTYYTDLTVGLGIRQFYKIGVSQTDPEVVTGGSQDNGTSVYDATGNWTDWLGADGMECFVDKDNSNIMYGTSQFGSLYKSLDGGASYSWLAEPDGKSGNWVTPFEQDHITQNTIYSGYDQVYKSINGGDSWTSISQNFGGNLDHLKIAPSDSNIIFASRGTNLYKTLDGGATNWSTLSGFTGNINSIAIHPSNPNKIAIATNSAQKVYVSIDGGTNWTSYLKDLPSFSALALVWEDNGVDGLYLGMNYGVYYIDNTYTTWQPFSNNLPNVIINELEINTANNKIYAATYGRGLWVSINFAASLSVKEFELNNISLFPNPASKEINLSWNRNEDVTIRVYNSIGKLIYFAKDKNLINPLKIDVSQYASGLYFVKINNTNGVITKKLIVN